MKIIFLFCLYLVGFSSSYAQARDYYEVLGLTKAASSSDIKTAHRKLVRLYHPDLNPNDSSAVEKFREVQEAYDILSDSEKRKIYDEHGVVSSRDLRHAQYEEDSYEKKARAADRVGAKYSNDKWVYDSTNHRFYDNRIRKWSEMDALWGSFYTKEGWLFYPQNGMYLSVALGADWNPEDGRGWFRKVSNFNNDYISIDHRTGFALSTTYRPVTVSDSSELFDQIFNPVTLLDMWAGRGNRKEDLEALAKLDWTPERKADFIERAKAHTLIFKHPDMWPRFTTHVPYTNAFLESILDNEASREFSEIVVGFIKELHVRNYQHLGRVLVKPEWINHPNAGQWLTELARNDVATSYFISSLFITVEDKVAAAKQFEKVFPIFKKVGLGIEAIGTFLRYVGSNGEFVGFEASRNTIRQFINTRQFAEFIASHEIEGRETVNHFLSWYKSVDPAAARVYSQALEMPGVVRNDYFRLTPDRTEYKFAEAEYNAVKKAIMNARIQFIEQNIKAPTACSSLFSL